MRVCCPQCKAKTEKQAQKMCRPKHHESGEYECVGMYMDTDKQGFFVNHYVDKTPPTQQGE